MKKIKKGSKRIEEVNGKKVEFEVTKVETNESGYVIVHETGKEVEE